MTPVLRRCLLITAVCTSLSACQDARRALGYEKAPPDEFQVIQRAPLSVPPDFALRPPAPGAVRPQEGSTTEQAKAVLQGKTKVQPMAISTAGRDTGDITLLKHAGADTVQPGVRELVDKENLAQTQPDRSFTDTLMFWRDKPDPSAPINATSEEARLRNNLALGRSAKDPDVPQVERAKTGFVEGVLDWVPWPF